MEKVKVTKEVAEAIETLRRNNVINYNIARAFTGDATFYNEENADAIDVLGYHFRKVDDLYRVLLNGYEVDKTPEEKIAEIYKKALSDAHMHSGWNEWTEAAAERNKAKGIKLAIDTLGITIEGVNA